MLISILGVFWNIYSTVGSSCCRYNMIQNDAIMHESVVEYCNRVNSRLLVIKFNAACWNQYWEYSGIYIVLLVHHVANIKYDTEWCDYAWECCRIL